MTDSVQRKKRELRLLQQKKRDALTAEEVSERSAKIGERVLELDMFQSAEIIHSYVPIAYKKEVDTRPLIQKILESDKTVVVPKMASETQLEHYQLRKLSDLIPNKWGIPEPAGGMLIAPTDMDLILVPMLAGDKSKNRLGYGKGFYDRLFLNTKAVKIGLLYHFQLLETPIPTGVFDIPLDILITDQTVVK